ncbi:hypothetical protein NLX67_03360 [Domibacillus sp. A3M-37]|uniref:hypothetical protein n=1 Tax=Domibacillus sp. A3M-37 TaxID=2962037 RepID=UPI0020B78B27|nr:hypothetical protein [Domibacillus sp. A3M-37]MCP3761429.1 hypothetical protein [Domibacillus sp. A3M-37]
MTERYHRIVIDGEVYYREYCEGHDSYGDELLTEEELVEILLGEVVDDEITVDPYRVENAILRIMDRTDQNLIHF